MDAKKVFYKILVFSSIFLASAVLYGQELENVGIGQWRLHLPYNNGIAVAEGNGRVFCAARYGMFSYNKSDGSIERLSRISGLSDDYVSVLKYHAPLGILIVAYDNSNIDLIANDGSIFNISDIKRKNIVGNKSIFNITLQGNIAYLCCGFGIVQLDLGRKEIKDTWYIGPNGTSIGINGLASNSTHFFAATDNGIYKAAANDPNLFNYTAWSKDSTLPYPGGKYGSISFFSNRIFTVNNDSANVDNILTYDGTTWSYFKHLYFTSTKIDSYKNHLTLKNYFTAEAYNANLDRTHLVSTGGYPDPHPNASLVDEQNVFWIADEYSGLVRHPLNPYVYEIIQPNGPSSIAVYAMESSGDDLWVATGGLSGTAAKYAITGTYWFSGNSWSSYNMINDPKYAALPDSRDVISVAIDPSNSKHAFLGTWGSGLLEYGPGGVVTVYDTNNSALRPLNVNGFHPTQVGGLAYDEENNLWATTNLNPTPLTVKKTDGTWQNIGLPPPLNNTIIYNLLIDGYDQKWMVARGSGVGVFNENDLSNPNDNSFKFLNNAVGNGNLPSLNIFSIVEDKDNTIWIGSDKGVAVIYNPSNVFVSGADFDAQKIIVEEGGYAQYLLESESVSAIAVDGANRKWFGTLDGGAFLQSADGTQKLLNFNTSNSPLLSNTIWSIAVNDKTGEVFFGTDKGIISYRGSATEGGEECEELLAFPNPVKHDYDGLIAVRGLVANADVKITDISGTVVYQAKASGGQVVWDGKNFDGKRAHSGVYLIYASNEDGSATCVTRLLFMN